MRRRPAPPCPLDARATDCPAGGMARGRRLQRQRRTEVRGEPFLLHLPEELEGGTLVRAAPLEQRGVRRRCPPHPLPLRKRRAANLLRLGDGACHCDRLDIRVEHAGVGGLAARREGLKELDHGAVPPLLPRLQDPLRRPPPIAALADCSCAARSAPVRTLGGGLAGDYRREVARLVRRLCRRCIDRAARRRRRAARDLCRLGGSGRGNGREPAPWQRHTRRSCRHAAAARPARVRRRPDQPARQRPPGES